MAVTNKEIIRLILENHAGETPEQLAARIDRFMEAMLRIYRDYEYPTNEGETDATGQRGEVQ